MPAQSTDYKYFAFISYSRKDSKVAAWLQKRLEWFRFPVKLVPEDRRPPHPRFIQPIYRDKTNLEVTDEHYWQNIRRALEESRFLIILCSPHSAASQPVDMEVSHFFATHNNDASQLLPVIVSGDVKSSGNDAALGPTLRSLGELLIDRNLPTMVSDEATDDQDAWEQGFVSLVSYLLRLDRKAIGDHIQREAKRQARVLRRWLVAVVALTLLAFFGAVVAWQQKNQADMNASLAKENEIAAKKQEQKARTTLSMSDFIRANELIAAGEQADALAYLARAVRGNPQNVAAGRRALMLLQEQPWFVPQSNGSDFVEIPAIADHDLGDLFSIAQQWSIDPTAVARDPISRVPVIGSGILNEFANDGFVTNEFEGQHLQHTLRGPCESIHFFPQGYVFTTFDRHSVRLWGLDGSSFGRVEGDNVGTGSISADGRKLGANLRIVGRTPIVQIVGEDILNHAPWHAEKGDKMQDLKRQLAAITGSAVGHVLAIAPDHFAVDQQNVGIDIWCVSTRTKLGTVAVPYGTGAGIALHPSGSKLLFFQYRTHLGQIWDVRTGTPEGREMNFSRYDGSGAYSPDGSFVATDEQSVGGGETYLKVWDSETVIPLSRNWVTRELACCRPSLEGYCDGSYWKFNGHGQFFHVGNHRIAGNSPLERTIFMQFEFPPQTALIPRWFPDLLEIVGGRRIAEKDTLVTMGDSVRIGLLDEVKRDLLDALPTDRWAAIIRWWLDDSPQRMVAPGSSQSVNDYVRRRIESGRIFDLHLAIQAAPEKFELYDLISKAYSRMTLEARTNAGKDQKYALDAEYRSKYFFELFRVLTKR